MREVHLLIPAAAEVRPGQQLPVWLLTRPSGDLLLAAVLRSLDCSNVSHIAVIVLAAHVRRYAGGNTTALATQLRAAAPDLPPVEIVELAAPTSSGVETVAAGLRQLQVPDSAPIFIKDADGAFRHTVVRGNYVVAMQVTAANCDTVHQLPTKSFVEHCGGLLTNIVEKKMISADICVGGYGFDTAVSFMTAAAEVAAVRELAAAQVDGVVGPLFPSHLIYHLVMSGSVFTVAFTGTFADWKGIAGLAKYNRRFANLIVALEGVLATLLPLPVVSPAPSPLPCPAGPSQLSLSCEGAYTPASQSIPLGAVFADAAVATFGSAALDDRWAPITENIAALRARCGCRGEVPDVSRPAGVGDEGPVARVVLTTMEPAANREAVETWTRRHGIPCDDIIFGMMRAPTVAFSAASDAVPPPAALAHSVPFGASYLEDLLA